MPKTDKRLRLRSEDADVRRLELRAGAAHVMHDLRDRLNMTRRRDVVTLDYDECKALLNWWDYLSPKRGRPPESAPLVDYAQAEQARDALAAKTGKRHGLGKLVDDAMRKRWEMKKDDTARKRINAAYKAMGKQRG